MKKIMIMITFFIISGLNAQTINKKQIRSYLMPQVSLLNGDHATGAQVQIVGGIIKKNWHFGLGSAIDYYKLRSVPVFSDVRYHFTKSKKAFAYFNFGYNFQWVNQLDDRIYILPSGASNSKFNGGMYTDWGIGYNIKLGKTDYLSLSLGYSIKQMSEQYEEWSIWSWPRPILLTGSETTIRKFDYTFRRISFKMGYTLW